MAGLLRSTPRGVMVSVVAPALAWILVAASLVIGLAAVVRMSGPALPDEEIDGIIALPEPLAAIILGLFALAGIVFVVNVLRRGLFKRREDEDGGSLSSEAPRVSPWMRTLTQLLSLLNVLVVAYLLWRGAISFGGLLQLGSGASGGIGAAFHRTISASAPPLVTWAFGILAVASALGALLLALWVAL